MAHDHCDGGHSGDDTAGANAKMLGWALALPSTYLVVEVVGGSVFNSLARFNAILLFGIAIYVFVEAVQRFTDPEPVQSSP